MKLLVRLWLLGVGCLMLVRRRLRVAAEGQSAEGERPRCGASAPP